MGKKEKDQRLLRRNLLGVCVFLLALPVLGPWAGAAFAMREILPGQVSAAEPQGRKAQTPQEKRKQWRKNPQKKRGFSALMT